ncbi:hypothetical protein DPQ31_02650 [Bacillus sp. COPE52]|nr:hypothetical protein DPQ31_02650 [Bacillus sp. COPE52]
MYLSIRDEFHFFGESLHILLQLAKEPGFIKSKNKHGTQERAVLCNLAYSTCGIIYILKKYNFFRNSTRNFH